MRPFIVALALFVIGNLAVLHGCSESGCEVIQDCPPGNICGADGGCQPAVQGDIIGPGGDPSGGDGGDDDPGDGDGGDDPGDGDGGDDPGDGDGGDDPGDGDGGDDPGDGSDASSLLQSEVVLQLFATAFPGVPALSAHGTLRRFPEAPTVTQVVIANGLEFADGSLGGTCFLEVVNPPISPAPLFSEVLAVVLAPPGVTIQLRDASVPPNGRFAAGEPVELANYPETVTMTVASGPSPDERPSFAPSSPVLLEVPAELGNVQPLPGQSFSALQLETTTFAWGNASPGTLRLRVDSLDATVRLDCSGPNVGSVRLSGAALGPLFETLGDRSATLYVLRDAAETVDLEWEDQSGSTSVSFRVEVGAWYTVSP